MLNDSILTNSEVREVIEFESAKHPVLSIYLNVDPRRRSPEKYKLALRSLLDKASDANSAADPADIQRIQQYVELGYNWQGCGIIMFSCAAEDFWWAKSLLVPVEDAVMVSFRPYVRQLATLMDTYERYGVIHIEQTSARLYVFHMGSLEDVQESVGEEVKTHKAGGWSAARYQRHEAEIARQNLQDAAELAEEFYRKNQTRRLILAGTEKNVANFQDLLSNRLRTMVIGQIAVDQGSKPDEVRRKALDLAQNAATQEEAALADQVVTAVHKGGTAVVGLTETLTAVQNGRAQHVVVLADFAQPAYRFVDSGYIVLELDDETELGSGRIQKLPDAVDSVLRRAMVQGIGVTILEKHDGLAELGQIGALTRY